jgi:hypothetical protein
MNNAMAMGIGSRVMILNRSVWVQQITVVLLTIGILIQMEQYFRVQLFALPARIVSNSLSTISAGACFVVSILRDHILQILIMAM